MLSLAKALPSDLSLRAFILFLLIAASSGAIYSRLWSLARPAVDRAVADCLAGVDLGRIAQVSPAVAQEVRASTVVLLACARPETANLSGAAALGATLVL